MFRKTYVAVTAIIDENGKIQPVSIRMRDQVYPIDRVLCIRPAAALKAGGQGMRYTVRIGSHEAFLFQDEQNRWFVEEKDK